MAAKLGIEQQTAHDLVALDRIQHKFGPVLYRFIGEDPDLAVLAEHWVELSPQQKDFFRDQIRITAEANLRQRESRKGNFH
jgi:hypothetical protein